MVQPQNLQLLDELRFKTGLRIELRFGFQGEVLAAIERLYGIQEDPAAVDSATGDLEGMEFISSSSQERNVRALREMQQELQQKSKTTPAVYLVARSLQTQGETRVHGVRDIALSYEGRNEQIQVRPRNLSARGMFINTARVFPEGAVLNLRFRLAYTNVEVRLVVKSAIAFPVLESESNLSAFRLTHKAKLLAKLKWKPKASHKPSSARQAAGKNKQEPRDLDLKLKRFHWREHLAIPNRLINIGDRISHSHKITPVKGSGGIQGMINSRIHHESRLYCVGKRPQSIGESWSRIVEFEVSIKFTGKLQLLVDRMGKRQIHLRELVRSAVRLPAKKDVRGVEVEMRAKNVLARVKPDFMVVLSGSEAFCCACTRKF